MIRLFAVTILWYGIVAGLGPEGFCILNQNLFDFG